MRNLLLALLLLGPAIALAGTGEGGPGFRPGHLAGHEVLNCDGVSIFYGPDRGPLLPPVLLSSYSDSEPVHAFAEGDSDVYENSYFRLEFPVSVDNLGPSSEFRATLTESGSAPKAVDCSKGPAY